MLVIVSAFLEDMVDSMRTEAVLVKAANALSDVEEGIACAGTSLESKTFTVRGKAFLFIGPKNARLKLAQAAGEAKEWAAKPDSVVNVGTGGWVAIRFDDGVRPADSILRKWVAESHTLFAGSAKSPSPKPGAKKARGKARP